ncbi:MAG: hypothetical protein HOV94_15740 [Saccharothrix sp.]|nr:hypothetical protein [Saccharothrix sp.]
MWTWNGLIQDNVDNDHRARVPDGTVCGGGDRVCGALNTPGLWQAQDVPNTCARPGRARRRVHPRPRHQAGLRPGEPNDGCTATYTPAGQWAGGFQADVKVAAGATTTFGVQGNWLGTNRPPVLSCVATR